MVTSFPSITPKYTILGSPMSRRPPQLEKQEKDVSNKHFDNDASRPLAVKNIQFIPPTNSLGTPANFRMSHNLSIGNRFTHAQRDRTIRHHKLLQPSLTQERAHLANLKTKSHHIRESFSCLSLLTLPEEEGDNKGEFDRVSEHSDTLGGKPSYLLEDVSDEKALNFNYEEQNLNMSSQSSVGGSIFSGRSNLSQEDDVSSNASPTTTLYVPGEQSAPISPPLSKRELAENYNSTANFGQYCLPCEMEAHSSSHRFVVCADTQFGITSHNANWDAEAEYSIRAVDLINSMDPLPSFVCVCGDLVDMEYTFEKKKGRKSKFTSTLFEKGTGIASREVCDAIQDEQNEDFKNIWSQVHPDIALVCLCGNHDVGNRPTPRSIARFRAAYGDEYLAFWANGTYNIVLNNVLFIDPSGAKNIYNTQLCWLEDRLKYARDHQAKQIFVFAHHPWFLYDENEDPESLTGASPYPAEWVTDEGNQDSLQTQSFPDSYFSMPKYYRYQALDLFRKYGVDACFSGHFHQNLISRTCWGMDMIITAPLSLVFESTGKKNHTQGQEYTRKRKMTYEDEEAMLNGDISCLENNYHSSELFQEEKLPEEKNCRGIRVVDVKINETSGFSHWFVPL